MSNLREVATLFLRLGAVAFGGPYAHAGMMEQEAVQRRHWLDEAHFAEGLAVCQALPGPMSTQLAIWLGYVRAGFLGGIVAGVCFILPACVLISVLAAIYLRVGRLPSLDGIFYGVNAAVIAVLIATAWRMATSAVKEWFTGLLFCAVLCLALLRVPLVWLLLGAGLLGMLRYGWRPKPTAAAGLLPLLALIPLGRLAELAWVFLKAGALLYGGGFVIIAFVEQDVVRNHAWLTHREFLDSVALGQITPGPILVTATFIGFKVAGLAGAAVATVAIFLPSFVYILLAAPNLAKIRKAVWFQSFIKGANPAVAAAIFAAAWSLAAGGSGRTGAVRDIPTGVIFVASLAVLMRYKIAAPWVVAGAAVVGFVVKMAIGG